MGNFFPLQKKYSGRMQHEETMSRLYLQETRSTRKKIFKTYKAKQHEKDFFIPRNCNHDGSKRIRHW
jgi:hypothetical protein